MASKKSNNASFLITFAITSALSVLAQAKDYQYDIKGMKCDACVESIKEKVCSLPGIEKCTVEVGHMNLTLADKKAPTQKVIAEKVKEAGHYKVLKVTEATGAAEATTPEKK